MLRADTTRWISRVRNNFWRDVYLYLHAAGYPTVIVFAVYAVIIRRCDRRRSAL